MQGRPNNYELSRNVHRITLYSTVSSEHQHPSNFKPRLYLHLDMNCFYAQVEQQSYNLFGLPLIIGGWRKGNGTPRGIVATSSYEARACGIKTAMSHYEATKLCPYVVPLQVHYEKYQAVSREIRSVIQAYSPDVEGYSMDEYFLNVTHLIGKGRHEIEAFGNRIKNDIYAATTLVCSVGIAYSKTYAKLASDLRKPDGLTLILDEADAKEHLWPLKLKEVWGIGKRRYARLEKEGVHTIAEAVQKGEGVFRKCFGAYFGQMLHQTATGKDCARIIDTQEHVPKEVCYMHTFSDWTDEYDRVVGEIAKAVVQLAYRMRGYNRKAEFYSAYIRFQDEAWKGVKFAFQTEGPTYIDDYILYGCLDQARGLIKRYLGEGARIRGIGLSTLEMTDGRQMELFFSEDERLTSLYYAVDHVNNRYGINTLLKASLKHTVEGKTHFLDRNSGQ